MARKRRAREVRRVSRPARTLIAGVAVVCSTVATTLFATAGPSAAASPVTITYLTHWGPPQVKMLQTDAARFHKANPSITVQFHAVPFANLLSTLTTQGPSAGWTVASIYDLWLPQLVQAGLAAPAPAVVAKDVRAHWPTNLATDVTKNGQVRGYPNEVDLYALNYNKALFKAAHITAPPRTWTQLGVDAARITNKAKGIQGFGVITSWPAGVVHPWLSLVYSNGGQILKGTTPTLTSANVLQAAQLYAQLVHNGLTNPTMSAANANTTGPYLENFTSGKTGMIIMANWWESSLKTAMGARFSDVGVAPIPVGPSGKASHSVSYSWLTMVNARASSAQRAASWKFLQWLNGPTSGAKGSSAMGDALLSMGILPSRTSDVTAHKAQLSDAFLKTYVAELKTAIPFPTVLGGEQMTDTIQTALESIIFGRSSPSAALRSAQSQVATILKNAAS